MNGRCPTCGSRPVAWSPQRIIEACQRWAAEHDGEPPRANDWRCGTPEHPADATCCAVFGGWNKMLVASGFPPRNPGAQKRHKFTKKQVEQLVFEHMVRHGRLPKYAEWMYVGEGRPTASQVARMYGSWGAMIVAAGYEHRGRGSGGRTRAGYRAQAAAVTRNANTAAAA